MRLHYIYHSCFVAQEDGFLIVYDYWRDPQQRLEALLREYETKTVYFVVSHFHEDHFNPDIAEWCASNPSWHLLPSYDTVRRRRIDKSLPMSVLRFGERVEAAEFVLTAYRSTDVGVCTVTQLHDGTTLFHAGDCNNWRFPSSADESDSDKVKITPDQMEKLFLSILRDIKKDYPHIHHAMFPVDPRLGQEMMRGPMQLLSTLRIDHFYPMHYTFPASFC